MNNHPGFLSPSLSSLSQSDLECRMVDKGAIWFGKAAARRDGGREGEREGLDRLRQGRVIQTMVLSTCVDGWRINSKVFILCVRDIIDI